MKMKFDIDWDTVEGIGTEYVKAILRYVALLETFMGMILTTMTTKKSL